MLLTNLVGEQAFLSSAEFEDIVAGTSDDAELLTRLRTRHMVRVVGDPLPAELLAVKVRTRMERLRWSTGLHMFVVTLRCEHTCKYCQVSRQSTARDEFDMSEEAARRSLDLAFRSPSRQIKIEFQGGEPLLNFPRIEQIVLDAEKLNTEAGKDLAFVIATNLALLDDRILDFADEHEIQFSTSIDGPAHLHNANRRRPGQDSWERTVDGIRAIQERLGPHRVSALMTTTEASLDQPAEIIDSYLELGLNSVFLRPISPYGFATRLRGGGQYGVDRWLEFFRAGLEHIIDVNRRGRPLLEVYTAIVASKMFTNNDPGYVDLTSPSGIGIGGIVYNYDGKVYASDEGRMLAEMHDDTFLLGDVHHDSYADIMLSDKLLDPLMASFTQSVPKCDTCAFEPYCGADPVYHHTTMRDFVGHKAHSGFCRRNMGVFTTILEVMRSDEYADALIRSWVRR